MITRFDSRSIRDSEYLSLREAAKLIGRSVRTLEIARREKRLLTLRENPCLVTGAQLKNYVEAPKRKKG